jgi:hypothetical protein
MVLSLFLAMGCGRPQTPVPEDWTMKSASEKRALLDTVADNCGVTHESFRMQGDSLVVQPHPDADYENVDCALGALKRIRGLPELGFVGNEYPIGNEQ